MLRQPVIIYQARNMSFFTRGPASRNKMTDVERVMHKMKKPDEDLFVYEARVVNCWC
ncbi:hypothetical protein LINPERHAP2_LOCUS4160, partial [Linum perenne]